MTGFIAPDAERALAKMEVLFLMATMGPLLVVQWILRDTTLEAAADKCPWWMRSLLLAIMLLLITIMPGEDRAFIYFQF